MDTTKPGPRSGAVGLLLACALLASCQDGADPVEPVVATDASEAALDQAVATLATMDARMEAEVDRERDRDRTRDRDRAQDRRAVVDRVGLAVELGGTAVSLATRILDEQGAEPAQLSLLESASEFESKAVEALADGDGARAAAFAVKACWTALKAVVLPGGVSEEEARMIHDLAQELLVSARAQVEASGTPQEVVLLGWAERFFEVGSGRLTSGSVHGVAALWKCAVIAAWIVG